MTRFFALVPFVAFVVLWAAAPAAAADIELVSFHTPDGAFAPYVLSEEEGGDASWGTRNGVANPGETLAIALGVAWHGAERTQRLRATLERAALELAGAAAPAPAVEILARTLDFGALAPGAASGRTEITAAAAGQLRVRLPAAAPAGCVLKLTVAFADGDRALGAQELSIPLETPPALVVTLAAAAPLRARAAQELSLVIENRATAAVERARVSWSEPEGRAAFDQPDLEITDLAAGARREIKHACAATLHPAVRTEVVELVVQVNARMNGHLYRTRQGVRLPVAPAAWGTLVWNSPIASLLVVEDRAMDLAAQPYWSIERPAPGDGFHRQAHALPAGTYTVTYAPATPTCRLYRLFVGGAPADSGTTLTIAPAAEVKMHLLPPDVDPAVVDADKLPLMQRSPHAERTVLLEVKGDRLEVRCSPTRFPSVFVARGKFNQGWSAGPGLTPQRERTLSAFEADLFEVTNRQYGEFLKYAAAAHARCHKDEPPGKDHTPATWDATTADQRPYDPVTGVDWFDAYAFAAARDRRLPTEAEWERLARTGDQPYPWGADEAFWNRAQLFKELGDAPLPVGRLAGGRATASGAWDLAGNVAEWCADWYDPTYYGEAPKHDPAGPTNGETKVLRGGSWSQPASAGRVFARWSVDRRFRAPWVGFRTVKSVEEK
ncbi:MAG: SUMF1/EgtB/PvdO family nonheme iron enzyme [Planctomycetes bacterium]|nr:SUMF1/EgtB/PvdO family nonheme iron enzyme [Planctomycetota bacterium]